MSFYKQIMEAVPTTGAVLLTASMASATAPELEPVTTEPVPAPAASAVLDAEGEGGTKVSELCMTAQAGELSEAQASECRVEFLNAEIDALLALN